MVTTSPVLFREGEFFVPIVIGFLHSIGLRLFGGTPGPGGSSTIVIALRAWAMGSEGTWQDLGFARSIPVGVRKMTVRDGNTRRVTEVLSDPSRAFPPPASTSFEHRVQSSPISGARFFERRSGMAAQARKIVLMPVIMAFFGCVVPAYCASIPKTFLESPKTWTEFLDTAWTSALKVSKGNEERAREVVAKCIEDLNLDVVASLKALKVEERPIGNWGVDADGRLIDPPDTRSTSSEMLAAKPPSQVRVVIAMERLNAWFSRLPAEQQRAFKAELLAGKVLTGWEGQKAGVARRRAAQSAINAVNESIAIEFETFTQGELLPGLRRMRNGFWVEELESTRQALQDLQPAETPSRNIIWNQVSPRAKPGYGAARPDSSNGVNASE
jgi:hypothetical protein